MLQTLERTHTFDARVLTADNAAALRTLTGPGGLPLLPCLHPACRTTAAEPYPEKERDGSWNKNSRNAIVRGQRST